MRDEIFDVTIAVTSPPGVSVYIGTMELTVLGRTHQTLGNRRNVRMFHFTGGEEAIIDEDNQGHEKGTPVTRITFAQADGGIKTIQGVINIAQKVQIKAIDQQYHTLCAVSDEIEIVHRIRQYTTQGGNANFNVHDGNIIKQLNCWDDWNISPPPDPPEQPAQNQGGQTPQNQGGQTPQNQEASVMPYTFMTDAQPPAELVKAIAYKASGFNTNTPENLNLMGITAEILLCMTTGAPEEVTETSDGTTKTRRRERRDVNASALPFETPDRRAELTPLGWIFYLGTYSTNDKDAAPLMDYGTQNEDGTVEKAPTVTTVDDSFKWGIRWLIAKRTAQEYTESPAAGKKHVSEVKRIPWLTHDGTVKAYADSNGRTDGAEFVKVVRKLYAEGVDPNSTEENTTYLWPIKADGSARQIDNAYEAEDSEEDPEE
ncbi:MAG: hypothetical protein OXU23_17285 [Candidatus Poribacteria bacterium]|nr:hypothetical protein [Candidatus Poribacteria bacterium]